jgi:hypothetical protein
MFDLRPLDVNSFLPEIPKFQSFSETIAELVQESVQAIEADLKPDESLVVYCETPSGERVRALKFEFTGGPLVIVHGFDPHGERTYVIVHAFSFQMVCKVVKAKPEAKKTPIGFILPKESPEK